MPGIVRDAPAILTARIEATSIGMARPKNGYEVDRLHILRLLGDMEANIAHYLVLGPIFPSRWQAGSLPSPLRFHTQVGHPGR